MIPIKALLREATERAELLAKPAEEIGRLPATFWQRPTSTIIKELVTALEARG